MANYSITSSALSSREVGMARPNAMAVLRLSTNLNLVTCSIGMSAGLVPLRILSTNTAATKQIIKIHSIANQPAIVRQAQRSYGRQTIGCNRSRNPLDFPSLALQVFRHSAPRVFQD